jgi:hypothetical protein
MLGTSPDGTQVRPLMPPNAQTPPLANSSFGSAHTGICQFVFGDGSVHAISITTDLSVLSDLARRADGNVVNLDVQ